MALVTVFNNLTTGTQNTAIGNLAAWGEYKLTTGNNNVMVGYNSGATCEDGSNNAFLGCNVQLQPGQSSISGSIALGTGVVINNNNQLMVASTITSFNISGLTPSTGSGEGTIFEFDSAGNVIPTSTGDFDSVSKISSAITTWETSVTTNTSDITTLLSGGTVFTTSGSYIIPSNVTTLTIEAMGGGAEGSGGGTGSDGAWAGGGGGGSGALEKITIPATSRQIIDFTIGVGGAGGGGAGSGGNGTATTVTMYGQTILTANGGLGSTGIDGGDGATTSLTGVSCGGGGGMGSVNTSTDGTGGTGIIPGQPSTIYETQGTDK